MTTRQTPATQVHGPQKSYKEPRGVNSEVARGIFARKTS